MKDKLISMAPFFVIMLLVVGWGYLQGWFTPVPEEPPAPPQAIARETTATPPVEQSTPAVREEPATPPDAPPAEPAPTAGPDRAASTWSTYHGDENLAGIAAAVLPEKPVRLWRFQTAEPILFGPVASEKLLHFCTSQGEVVTVDLAGKKIWSKQITRTSVNDTVEQPARVDGPVSCFESTLLLGTMAGVVYALDATTGDIKWQHDIGSAILGAVTYLPAALPARPNARVFVIGQDDGALHCLAFEDGAPIWKSEPIDRCDGSPAAGDGIITFGSCASALHVINAVDGVIMKNVPVGEDSQIASGVAVRGTSIFSGSHSGHLIHADLAAGKIVWANDDSDAEVFTTPAVSADRVVYGSMDDFVYCLDRATGKQLWKFDTNGLPTSAVIAGAKVVFSADGTLYMLSLATGEVLWSFEVSDEITAPSIINDMMLVGGKDGSLSAFGAAKQ